MIVMNGEFIFMCLCSLMQIFFTSAISTSDMPISCDKEGIVVTAAYNRFTGRVSVRLRLFQTLDLIRFDNGHLIALYPWVCTELMTTEEFFAREQVTFLKTLALKFLNSTIIMITYMLAEGEPLITVHIDSSSTVSQGYYGISSFGPNGHAMEPYANGTYFDTILGTRGAILSRWRMLCNLTKEKDKPENMMTSFFYDPNAYMFHCELRTHVPMRYYFYLRCDGCKTVMGKIIALDDGDTIIGRVINRSHNKPNEVACVILSPHGWERTLVPTTKMFVSEVSTVGRTPDMVKRYTRSRMGIYLTIALVCVIVFAFLISIFFIQKKLSSKSSENFMNRIRLRLRYFSMNGEQRVVIDRE